MTAGLRQAGPACRWARRRQSQIVLQLHGQLIDRTHHVVARGDALLHEPAAVSLVQLDADRRPFDAGRYGAGEEVGQVQLSGDATLECERHVAAVGHSRLAQLLAELHRRAEVEEEVLRQVRSQRHQRTIAHPRGGRVRTCDVQREESQALAIGLAGDPSLDFVARLVRHRHRRRRRTEVRSAERRGQYEQGDDNVERDADHDGARKLVAAGAAMEIREQHNARDQQYPGEQHDVRPDRR
jgi:hypothetical protein